MRTCEYKKVRGCSLKPGRRELRLDPGLRVSSLFANFPEQKRNVVRVFDEDGGLRTREVGVKRFQFARLSVFYTLRSLTWPLLCTYLFLLYLAVLFVFAALYLAWGDACGAWQDTTWTTALYFTVVSLAANGGYFGEPADTMLSPAHPCFSGRTFLVMMLSYTNIIFVGLVAALVVGKAQYSGRLGQRVVFSEFCSLTPLPGHRGRRWGLTFRMANSSARQPLAHGRLRVFIVTAEPLKETSMMHVAAAPERPRRGKGGGGGRQRPQIVPPSTAEPPRESREASACYFSCTETPQGEARRTSERGKRQRLRRQRGQQPSETCGDPTEEGAEGEEARATDVDLRSATELGSSSATGVEAGAQRHGVCDSPPPTAAGPEPAQRQEQPLQQQYSVTQHPVAAAGAGAGVSSGYSEVHIPVAASCGAGGNDDSNEDDDGFEGVDIRVEELRWTCPNERYLEARQGQLSLWVPVSITHVIDRRSPLYRYLGHEGADDAAPSSQTLLAEPAAATATTRTTGSLHSFQIVATFDATEMESGATIMAKRTYTANDIVAHYRFSNKVVLMRPGSREVLVDYHYFNELLPAPTRSSAAADGDAPHLKAGPG
ncbi:uncharacterized protein Tco025E_02688 [Trypanosoma conorhini]|uniref:Uncharacterized protein n=1 Tax=Trypanosoma conorhini TaxID=83891 RepID=A0A3R7M013_9TRYP|nr:uncharacterized protein Tco025E_02688 [Trypanosoma conorhini]RNF23951.1 hypothetical protein Tco025E_02688 [Trypanosoma conorhini]